MPRRSRLLKRNVAAIVAVTTASIATGACSLIVSTDDLQSAGASDASLADVVIVDSAKSDVVTLSDAHDEIAIDAAPVAFCVKNVSALFCDDFDKGPVGATWDDSQNADGTISLNGTLFESSPFSAVFSAAGNSSVVQLERSLAASSGNYRVAFSLHVGSAPSGSAYQILARIANGKGAQLELYEDKDGFSVNDRINGTYGTFYAGIPDTGIGTWIDFVFHVKLAASGGKSSTAIDINGANVVPTFDIDSAFNVPSAVDLAVGLPYDSGSNMTVAVDNVAISTD